ncbi:hypothetical protein COT44_00335 [Candidatus Shapirobacteria bacterium CG08_land_8_20_14_0_20_39_18]|uniref:Uncharacterized protein n=1 Tax=Candidatus Shapirobacteria bacterium CG08_land_8_20_14_0_20_39_18 TaxID=1974883 RepID=A0A2M6XE48_9BACT|nr:MAG: hypothetical protein COT44_00335 [Candidatus Shapirobacteria bacterium CG08_land_8_20_14_0_20_39_18]PIY64715.1 MAG: hypothetical protein COY91_04575 [Candidatus Shapirobacteria bacterium CG_4_10_14_0_8_um_filter_39_15]PJE68667.1 MAG: hypothetical protein COU94_00790 [Candidatus Shapirobacteria bacterium CG10_big_fil_rev_8_21_14_0_10_38_8]
MLTKSDFQSIKDILKNTATKDDLTSLATKDDFESIKQDLGILKTDVKTIKNDVTKVRRDMTTLFDFLDKDFLDLRQRVDRIEEHLGLPPLS